MIFTQYYLDCLSQASYLIGDETTGRAVVVDPRRDISEYLADASAAGLTIELVIETHLHADFVSGHLELAAATGAQIGYGEAVETEFPSRKLVHGERISLGEVTLDIKATPGHTPESISVVVHEHPDAPPYGVLTGDALFIGDVGRPDLLSAAGMTADELAGELYESIHRQLLTLPDDTRVFPAHGAGSACGKNLSTERSSTIGDQRRTNYALAPMTKEEFVARITEGQIEAPAYFSYDAARNREDHPLLSELEAPTPLTVDEVVRLRDEGAVVLDTRDPADFAVAHLRGAVNVGLGGRFAEFAGAVVPPDRPIALVTQPGMETEARVRLARIGFDSVAGALSDVEAAFLERPAEVVRRSRLTVEELEERRLALDNLQVVDVRAPGEVELGALPDAVNVPLGQLPRRAEDLDPASPTVVYCAGGYRSSIAASWLAAHGFADVSELLGGYAAWSESGRTVTI